MLIQANTLLNPYMILSVISKINPVSLIRNPKFPIEYLPVMDLDKSDLEYVFMKLQFSDSKCVNILAKFCHSGW